MRNMYCLAYRRALQSSRLSDITYATFLSVISAETLLFRRNDKVILPVSNFSGGFAIKWVACYCIMQNSTRYQNAALGVDFQMLRHNIIVDIIRWSIPKKKIQFSISARGLHDHYTPSAKVPRRGPAAQYA